MKQSKEEIIWEKKEERELAERILKLQDDQIGALLGLVAGFKPDTIEDVVVEIREHGLLSGHLPILVEESSKEDLVWWVSYLEKKRN